MYFMLYWRIIFITFENGWFRIVVISPSFYSPRGDRYAIVEELYNLTIIKSSATGTCLTDSANRQQINFGINMVSGCLIRYFLLIVTTIGDINDLPLTGITLVSPVYWYNMHFTSHSSIFLWLQWTRCKICFASFICNSIFISLEMIWIRYWFYQIHVLDLPKWVLHFFSFAHFL